MATKQRHHINKRASYYACLCGIALLITACTSTPPKVTPQPDPNSFAVWQTQHQNEIAALTHYLAQQNLSTVLPMPQLLRSASDWQQCQAKPFAVPPQQQWASVASVLSLLQWLMATGVVSHHIEVYSGYRSASLNACADGAPNSTHTRSFALDFSVVGTAPSTDALCHFWRTQGKDWNMGLSIYPSGRIHIDTTRYRTWGYDYTRQSAMCRAPES